MKRQIKRDPKINPLANPQEKNWTLYGIVATREELTMKKLVKLFAKQEQMRKQIIEL
jgi:hypothetical protein